MDAPACPACQRPCRSVGAGEHACASCGGRFLEPGLAQLEIERHVGLSRAELTELAAAFGGKRTTCPGCAREMRPLTLRSVPLSLCFGCGALWIERGGLARLTDDPDREVSTADLEPLPALGDEDDDEETTDTGLRRSVVLADERAPQLESLVRAFTAVGRTRFDAERYQRSHSSVLLDKVDPEIARDFRAALGADAERVALIDAGLLEIPLVFDAPRLSLQEDAVYAWDHLDRERRVPYADIDAIAAAFVPGRARKSGFTLGKKLVRSPSALRMKHEVQRGSDDVFLLGLIFGDTRLRLASDRLPSIPLSKRADALREITESLAERRPVALHPQTRAALATGARPPFVHSIGELDRELAWAAWRTRAAEDG